MPPWTASLEPLDAQLRSGQRFEYVDSLREGIAYDAESAPELLLAESVQVRVQRTSHLDSSYMSRLPL